MARTCIYECNSGKKLTAEHVINASLLRKLYPNSMKYYMHSLDTGKTLQNFEPKIKDVCEQCNNVTLSPYDKASLEFTDAIFGNAPNKTVNLPFNQDSLGWLLKTHLNIARSVNLEKQLDFKIDRGFYTAMRDHTLGHLDKFALTIAFFENDVPSPKFGPNAIQDMGHHFTLHEENIVECYFRLKKFESYLFVSKDQNYEEFGDNVFRFQERFKNATGEDFRFLDVPGFLARGEIVISSRSAPK